MRYSEFRSAASQWSERRLFCLTKRILLQLPKISRHRRFEKHPLPCPRVREAELPRVQHLSRGDSLLVAPVEAVAQNGMSEMMHVNTDLVCAAAVQRALHETDAALCLQNAIIGSRRSTAFLIHRHFFAMNRMPANRRVDRPARSPENAGDEREIDFCDLAIGELAGKLLVRGVVLRHDHRAAGLLIEPMHNAGTLLAADARQGGAMMQERIDQCVRLITRPRMNNEPGWLIDDKQVFILKEKRQRNILRLRGNRLQRRHA